jgi:hypothetical protein
MCTQTTFDEINGHGLSEADFEPVRELISEVRLRESLIKASITWQNAFKIFRGLQKRLGLPRTEREKIVYLAIVSDLRSCGYWLLEAISAHGEPANLSEAGIPASAIKAGLTALETSDKAQFLDDEKSLLQALESHFA